MPSIEESRKSGGMLKAPLDAGLNTISSDQMITFTLYVKLILPLDGFVFWVRSDLVSQVALCNACKYSIPVSYPASGLQPPLDGVPDPVIHVAGSLHYASNQNQNEDESMTINSVIFTAQSEVEDFNRIGPCTMYIGEFQGVRFSFNTRKSFYQQAGIHHYTGNAIYPAMESQIIDDLCQFDSSNVIVSNSLPIWLSLNQFMPMYPSYLVTENLEPPYAAVHIPADSTTAMAAAPTLSLTGSHSQLVQEKVKITLYGMRNFNALDFQDYLFQYSLDHPDLFGIMNMPVMRDEKRTQSELNVIAQKKTFEIEINYHQTRVRQTARQLILHCLPLLILQNYRV